MEKQEKFTPGPWRPLFNGAEDTAVASPGGIIADIRCIDEYPSHAQVDANAHLIAAAPELYEALEMVRDADEDCRRDGGPRIPPMARAKIDAALAKARGESA